MAIGLFVGNLAWAATDRELRDAFSDNAGVTMAEIVRTRGGRSCGFGYITVMSEEEVQEVLNRRLEIRDRILRCEMAKGRTGGRKARGARGESRG